MDSGLPKVGEVDVRRLTGMTATCIFLRWPLAKKMRRCRAGGEIFLDSNSTGFYYRLNARKEVIHVDRK